MGRFAAPKVRLLFWSFWVSPRAAMSMESAPETRSPSAAETRGEAWFEPGLAVRLRALRRAATHADTAAGCRPEGADQAGISQAECLTTKLLTTVTDRFGPELPIS